MIKQEIQAHSIGSVDELLEDFAKNPVLSPLLENPVLNETSFALHSKDVSPQFPRIILHQPGLVMMVDGDRSKEGSEVIELIEYQPANQRFKFSLINFFAKGTPELFVDDAEDADFSKFKHPSFKSITQCSMCHKLEAQESKPRWGTGPLWQTPFGKVDDRILAGSKHLEEWKLFLKTLQDPELGKRYRLLRYGPIDTEADGSVVFRAKPNQALAIENQESNLGRIARIIRASKNYNSLQYALAGAVLGCGDFLGFFPKPALESRLEQLDVGMEKHQKAFGYQFWPRDPSLFVPVLLKAILQEGSFRPPSPPPGMVYLTDAEIFRLSHGSPLETFRSLIEELDQANAKTIIFHEGGREQLVDLTGFHLNGIDFSHLSNEAAAEKYHPAEEERQYTLLAKLRFLFEDSVDELPVNWSTAVSFPFGTSFRFGAGEKGLAPLLSQELGPEFLKVNPDLAFFKNGRMDPAELAMPLDQFCHLLKEKTVARLK